MQAYIQSAKRALARVACKMGAESNRILFCRGCNARRALFVASVIHLARVFLANEPHGRRQLRTGDRSESNQRRLESGEMQRARKAPVRVSVLRKRITRRASPRACCLVLAFPSIGLFHFAERENCHGKRKTPRLLVALFFRGIASSFCQQQLPVPQTD